MTSKVNLLSLDSLVTFKDPLTLWKEHWFGLVFEIMGIFLLYQVFMHARRRGAESTYLILTAIITTICFEMLPLTRISYEVWWYHQGLITIMRQRLPSYIISCFVIIHYLAENLTKDMNLPCLTRASVSAVLGVVLISPFLWVAPRVLLITYHYGDPLFKDRLVDIPYIQLLILLLLFFHTSYLFQQNFNELQPQERNTSSYLWCAFQSGIVSAIYATVEQYLFYLLIKLIINLNTGFCLISALALLIYLSKLEMQELQLTSTSIKEVFQPLRKIEFWAATLVLIFITTSPLWLNTHNLKSTSSRQKLGQCGIIEEVSNTSPLYVTRLSFVCPKDTEQLPYDFHCEQKNDISPKTTNHYTICGKTWTNYTEIFKMMAIYSSLCLFLMYNLMRLSFNFKVEQNKSVFETKKLE